MLTWRRCRIVALSGLLSIFAWSLTAAENTPVTEKGDGLKAVYHDSINGPVILERIDGPINFDRSEAPPAPDMTAKKLFVKWTGSIVVKEDRVYAFHTETDGGVSLRVGGVRLIHHWYAGKFSKEGTIRMRPGVYAIAMEYYQSGPTGKAKLFWSHAELEKQLVPRDHLWSKAVPDSVRQALKPVAPPPAKPVPPPAKPAPPPKAPPVVAAVHEPKGGWRLSYPAGTIGFNFGSGAVPGLRKVSHTDVFSNARGFGFVNVAGLRQGGGTWPDPVGGTYVASLAPNPCTFKVKIPDGDYDVWLCAGKIIRPELCGRRYLLKINETALIDETPTAAEFDSARYFHRFIWTQYSRKPHAAWNSYIDVMYPSYIQRIRVIDETVTVEACSHFLSALILVPVNEAAGFADLVRSIRNQRIADFERTDVVPDLAMSRLPRQQEGDGDYIVFIPDEETNVHLTTEPTEAERQRTGIRTSAARGERVLLRIAVMPFADLGKSTLELADLKGPNVIPAAAFRGYFRNFISQGKRVSESGLLPSLTLNVEDGLTQSLWLLLTIPTDAVTGVYKGVFTFRPGQGKPTAIPVELDVHSFALAPMLPASFGLWGLEYDIPGFVAGPARAKLLTERCERLNQEIGLTSIEVSGLSIASANRQQGTMDLKIDPTAYLAARAAGMAQGPGQELLLANAFASVGRILRNHIGADIGNPGFNACFLHGMRQYRDFLEKNKIPLAAVAVDEPREMNINAWNQNLANTVRYADLCREAGLTTAVTIMADHTHGKDFTLLVDHCDIISTHAWGQSRRLMEMTVAKNKTLWLFNVGMDRYSWGFYNWSVHSTGRWEWHLCWMRGGTGHGGYLGVEWHNPWLTPRSNEGHMHYAPHADPRFKGGMVFQTSMLGAAAGITDYAYLYTLEQALKKDHAGAKAKIAAEARAFLEALRKAMPRHPEIHGLAPGSDGATVGMGIKDKAGTHVAEWRHRIAGYLKALNE